MPGGFIYSRFHYCGPAHYVQQCGCTLVRHSHAQSKWKDFVYSHTKRCGVHLAHTRRNHVSAGGLCCSGDSLAVLVFHQFDRRSWQTGARNT